MGVAALAYSALAIISDTLNENKIDFEISFIGSSEKKKDKLVLSNKEIPFNNLRGMNFYQWKSFAKLTLLPFRYNSGKILGFDCIFDVGAGDSFTDIYGKERFFNLLNSKRFFSLLGKKQILMPQTIGPFIKPKHEELAISVMKRMNAVISRDRQSYAYTTNYLEKERTAETIDLAFYLPYENTAIKNNKTNIGINVSGLLWHHGYNESNRFNLKADYRLLTRSILEYFISLPKTEIHLVPHVVSNNKHFEDDCMISEILQQKYPQLKIAPYFQNPIEAKSYISGLDFFIGARMHSCIAAYSSGIPVFPIAYSRKFNGLFSDTLGYQSMGDCVNQENEVILSNVVSAFKNKNQLKEQIIQSNNTLVKDRIKLLKSLILRFIR